MIPLETAGDKCQDPRNIFCKSALKLIEVNQERLESLKTWSQAGRRPDMGLKGIERGNMGQIRSCIYVCVLTKVEEEIAKGEHVTAHLLKFWHG